MKVIFLPLYGICIICNHKDARNVKKTQNIKWFITPAVHKKATKRHSTNKNKQTHTQTHQHLHDTKITSNKLPSNLWKDANKFLVMQKKNSFHIQTSQIQWLYIEECVCLCVWVFCKLANWNTGQWGTETWLQLWGP